MSLDLLKSVKGLCFYVDLDLLIKCTRAFEQEGRAQSSTHVDISTAVCLRVHAGGSEGECRNALGFWGFFVVFFPQGEGTPHFSLNIIHQFSF